MNRNITYGVVTLIALVVIIGGLFFLQKASPTDLNTTSTKYDSFAMCLSEKGAKFYGAFWCPHCREQKKMFENSAKLPYIECSAPNGEDRTPICIENGIDSYPTWVFADSSRLTGEVALSTLSEKTGCELPTEEVSSN